jgi:hypothetical protein
VTAFSSMMDERRTEEVREIICGIVMIYNVHIIIHQFAVWLHVLQIQKTFNTRYYHD